MLKTHAGRSIRLFLIDGNPAGLMSAEIMNWTGSVLNGPRSKLAEIVARAESKRAGIYFLIGPDPDDNSRLLVYIGESDDVSIRLVQHNRSEESGGKNFWERVCLITSKDHNLTKGHIKYLESLLITLAQKGGGCELINSNLPIYDNLPEADQADMLYFLEQIKLVLPVLGYGFLRNPSKPSSEEVGVKEKEPPSNVSPLFVLKMPTYDIEAKAYEVDGEFIVQKGSIARGSFKEARTHSYRALYEQLKTEGLLQADATGVLRFQVDYVFSSPSAAAAAVTGRSANGRIEWKTEQGQTYADWQQEQVERSV